MDQLVFKSSKGNPVTTSLIVADEFQKEHKNVLRDIENLSCSQEFRRLNFALSSYKNSQNKTQPMVIMTKDGFTFLAMGYTGEKAGQFKESFIEAFNTMEQKLRQSVYAIPKSFAEALELAASQAREIEAKDRIIAIQAPKVDFAERVIDNDTMVDIGQAAKLLKLSYGRNTFFKELRDKGIFFKNRNEPKQEFVERGYFELRQKPIETDHGTFSVLKIIVTQKGLFWLSKQFGVNLVSSFPELSAH